MGGHYYHWSAYYNTVKMKTALFLLLAKSGPQHCPTKAAKEGKYEESDGYGQAVQAISSHACFTISSCHDPTKVTGSLGSPPPLKKREKWWRQTKKYLNCANQMPGTDKQKCQQSEQNIMPWSPTSFYLALHDDDDDDDNRQNNFFQIPHPYLSS